MEPVTEGKKQLCAMCRYAWCLVTVHVLGKMKQASAWKIGKCYAVSVCVCDESLCLTRQSKPKLPGKGSYLCVCVLWLITMRDKTVQQHPTPSQVPAEWGNLCAGQSNKNATAVQKD